jgi:hypothetical protein
MIGMTLTDKERAVLDLERSWWVGSDAPATKSEAIAGLGLSRAQYYALRDSAVERAEAEAYDPLVVRRVRRDKAARRRARFEGRQTGDPRR